MDRLPLSQKDTPTVTGHSYFMIGEHFKYSPKWLNFFNLKLSITQNFILFPRIFCLNNTKKSCSTRNLNLSHPAIITVARTEIHFNEELS